MKEQLKRGFSPVFGKLLFSFFLLLFFSAATYSQNVTGTVTDGQGTAMQNVTVSVKGITGGTVTNASGEYTIKAAGNAVLVFSSVGYARQEVPVSGRTNINVTLANDAQNLNEVVVTALGIS